MGMTNVDKNIDKSNKKWFGSDVYPSQTKILEGGTKDDIRGSSFVPPSKIIAFCSYRRKFMLPKRRFRKDEQKMKCAFSIEFSTIRSPNLVLTTLKSASFEIRILCFVHPSQIFVWDGLSYRCSYLRLSCVFYRGLKVRLFGSPHCKLKAPNRSVRAVLKGVLYWSLPLPNEDLGRLNKRSSQICVWGA